MLGFVLGAACLVGVVAVARGSHRWGPPWRRFGRGFGCGRSELAGRWGYEGGWGAAGGRWSERGRWGRDFILQSLFESLETTPGQEKVFLSAAEEFRQAREKLREELDRSRREIAQALRSEQFNPASIREIFARHDLLIAELRNAALDSLSKIDEALDDRQRKRLADLIESGGGFHRQSAGSYRDYV